MGLLLRHADRLADLVLRVALAINAELLLRGSLGLSRSSRPTVAQLFVQGLSHAFAKLELPFSCPRPQIV